MCDFQCGDHSHEAHKPTLQDEIACHLPYAVFSVAFALSILSFWSFFLPAEPSQIVQACQGAGVLFHTFHFMHIVFSTTGTMITFFRYSKNLVKGLVFSVIASAAVCITSDILFPYIGGRLLGVPMSLHICWFHEFRNVGPFLLVGIMNGLLLGKWNSSQRTFSVFSHFAHILVSSFASLFYLISHGFTDWQAHIGLVFILLIVAVVIPCTLSDLVIPMMVAKADKRR